MKRATYILLGFVAGTIITGACNSIFTKLQDMQCVKNCAPGEDEKYFEEPVLQTVQMFVGEMLCWIPVFVRFVLAKTKGAGSAAEMAERRPLINQEEDAATPSKIKVSSFKTSAVLAIPSTCDLLGTTLMNAGLLYTPVSIYQMTRGSVILFVGLFSVLFLKRHINRIEWTSLFVVFFGVFLVGLSGWLSELGKTNAVAAAAKNTKTGGILLGMGLIFVGITFSAFQFVAEEHILSKIDVDPLELVGWEGLYGFLASFVIAIVGYVVVGRTAAGRDGQWDIIFALTAMFQNTIILLTSLLIMLSISSFNFFGISLTEKLSATARSTIDTSRTLLVWLISLAIGWESFKSLQLLAFALMVFGTLVFNGAINIDNWAIIPAWFKNGPTTKDSIIEDDVEANLSRR